MAKGKFLRRLALRRSSSKSSSGEKDVATTAALKSDESDIIKSHEKVLLLLKNFPESESESDRELSFSFLLNNSSPEKDTGSEKGGKTEEQCKEAAVVKEKKNRRMSRSRSRSSFSSDRIGVLLNLHVPASFTDYRKTRSGRDMPGITLEELQKREMEFSKNGCWSGLLGRKQDHNKQQLEAIPQLAY